LVPCRLLLLDEPAASLDAHSEQRVMQALTHASTQQTTLLVTHQLEGLADWDAVWVMQDGQIIEQGDYATLARGRRGLLGAAGPSSGGDLNARTITLSGAL
jgi:ATP-binding cassette subfamily C protein CydD